MAYCNLGNAHLHLGAFETAIDYHERYRKISKQLCDTLGEAIACSNLGSCYVVLGQGPTAIGYYQLAITLFNDIRNRLELSDEWKISLRDQYKTTYTALWRLMLAEGEVTEAFLSAERGRVQGLKDLMAYNYRLKLNDAESGTGNRSFHELSNRIPPNTIFMALGKNELVAGLVRKKGKFN